MSTGAAVAASTPHFQQVVRGLAWLPPVDGLVETATGLLLPHIVKSLNVLSRVMQDRVSKFVLPTLFLHDHVPEKIRVKVWSGEFVDLHTLLP